MAAKEYGDWVLTDSSKIDRHGTRIDIETLDIEAFLKNPIATRQHSDSAPIGYWSNVKKEPTRALGTLMIDPDASPEAAEAARLIEAGVLRASSAEFIGSADPDGLFKNAELVACSIVSIPSNPNAVRIRANGAETFSLIIEQDQMTETTETETETETQAVTPPMTEQRAAPLAPSGNAQPLAPAVHTRQHTYSLKRVLANQVRMKPMDGVEAEADQEIRSRQQWREAEGCMVPLKAIIHTRASATGSGANMQPLTGEQTLDQLFTQVDDAISPATLLDQLAVTRMSGLTEASVLVPRQTGMMAADHTALDSDLSVSADPTFSNVSLSPKMVGGVAEISQSAILAQHPALGTVDFIGNELRRALNDEIESVFLTGDNTTNAEEPDGLINSGTATSIALTAAGALTVVNGFPAIRQTLRNYSRERGVWVIHPDFADSLLSQAAFTGADASAYSELGLSNNTLLGDPVYYSNAISKTATTAGYYLVPQTVLHAQWEGVSVVANPWESSVFKKKGVLVRVSMMHDIALIDPKRVRHFTYDLS